MLNKRFKSQGCSMFLFKYLYVKFDEADALNFLWKPSG